ncbi:MAG: YhcH/YjgK/YiaL family protein [Peptoniphilaceae bacterium]|nr:YhcH/YjgK/YiaL family protein [Peptoniphilaceae bacterium]MDY6018780.1 YhcH/YjgK/YiaL family protein [Anaerococcus sp.]
MIFGNIKNLKEYDFLEDSIKECFAYSKNNDLLSYKKGSHEIDGDRLFVNIVEYETCDKDQRFWEAHKKYLDIHFMLDGEERIDLNFLNNMQEEDYVEEEDFLPSQGKSNSSVILRKGDFLICYPNDCHKTAIKVKESEKIKKAIFKVKIN